MSYDYNSWEPTGISVDNLDDADISLLKDSETFCIYPWLHLHTYPTGETYPCCHAEMHEPVGSTKVNTLKEIWNSSNMQAMRSKMLRGEKCSECKGCYEQEESGFFSGRKSANKHHGHHIKRVAETKADGHLDRFEMTYWDVRFSNLCNLSCRSCGHIFSSSWYKDQIALSKLHGDNTWGDKHTALNYAGQYKTDMFEQVMEHIGHVEQIYFAGGEPLTMEEHYKILDELERREMFHVRLIYNTNFTQVKLKDRDVFDYWKKFDSVSVGASLDAMGTHAEYIRTGTKWADVEANRRRMLEVCPKVDFYISPTVSIMNALHVTAFHKDWVEKGLLKPQDLNVNILQDPPHYRIDIATPAYKDKIRKSFNDHIMWLEGKDRLQRATTGFESAITFLDATDNTHLLPEFHKRVQELDSIRNEIFFNGIPELKEL